MASTIDFKVIDEILSRRPRDERSTIAILQDIQEVYHYLPREAFPYVAKAIGVGEARLYGVATFYENFSLEPKGKYVIRCCDGTACHVNGADSIEKALVEELGVGDGETTDDGIFSIKTVACLGCCSLSPVMMINEDTYGSLTPAKAKEIVRKIREASK